MSSNFIINQSTNMKNDTCLNNYYDVNNNKIFEHSFLPSIMSNNNSNNRNSYIDSTNNIGILQNNNYDLSGSNINESTVLRNGNPENNKSKKELDTRLFPGSPLMSNGQSVLKNPDLSSRLKYGESARVSKSENDASSYSANNFIPLVPMIAENIQNPDHIIPTYWVRGGMSSRTVVRNIDYLKSCGIKR
jgi:hypothetical protein